MPHPRDPMVYPIQRRRLNCVSRSDFQLPLVTPPPPVRVPGWCRRRGVALNKLHPSHLRSTPTPGPPLECIRGPHARSDILGKGFFFFFFLQYSLGKISRENQEKWMFWPMVTNTRDRGYILEYPFPEMGGGGSVDGE